MPIRVLQVLGGLEAGGAETFVFHLKEKQNELSYMKRVLMHWPT